jgi:flavodoxin
MKALVVYDTVFGNTGKVAAAVAEGLGKGARALRVGAAGTGDLKGLDLLVLGSPVRGGRATEGMQMYLAGISPDAARGLAVAAFDTRMGMRFARIFGYAADRMSRQMREKGAALRAEPEGFIVTGRNGPLADGERERAVQWGAGLAKG